MAASFARTVALRYFKGAEGRAEGRRFIRFVIYVSVGGVAVGVAALLLALTIVRGFSSEIEEKVVGFGSHVQVSSYLDEPLGNAGALADTLGRVEGVSVVTPVIAEFALIRSRAGIDGAVVTGTDPARQPFLSERILEEGGGRFSFEPDSEGRPGLVIGRRLAESLELALGDEVFAYATQASSAPASEAPGLGFGGMAAAAAARPRIRTYHVAGLYETGLADFDEQSVFVSLEQARTLFRYGADDVTRFDLMVEDIGQAEPIARQIGSDLGPPVLSQSVYELYGSLFAWIRLQQSIIPLVIGVIVIVAAFTLIGTLLMVVLEKTREIGILLAMGSPASGVRRLFLWLGLLIGAAGGTLGGALAFGLAVLQERFALIPLPQETYYLDRAPVELSALDFVWVIGLAVALCVVAAYVPARAASRIEPIRTIRFAG